MRKRVWLRRLKKGWRKGFFILFLLLVFLWVFFSFYRLWGARYRGERRFNLFLQFKNRSFLLSLSPERRMVVVVSFPNQMLVEAFGGYGEFRLDKLLPLANQEKKEELFSKSLEYFFGFSLDYWFAFPREVLKGDDLEDLKKNLIEKTRFLFLASGYQAVDRINLFNFNRFLRRRFLSWELFEAEKEGWVVDNRLQRAVWDDWASVYLADDRVKEEGLAVGVYNTTQRKGLAREVARILVNLGVRVVKVGNASKKVGECLVGIKESKIQESVTFKRIRDLLDCPFLLLPSSDFVDLTDINVYLGKEFLFRLRK